MVLSLIYVVDFTLKEEEFNKMYEVSGSHTNKEHHQRTYITIPSGSNYVTETVHLKSRFGAPDCPTYHVLSSLLNESFLLQYQQDSVYQTSSVYCPFRSTLTFYTYRDPHTVRSYKLFE